ncbi:group II intron maturase-specific domain-containing protein [Actinomadura sp. 7K507]|uniref:group II intron maturase-specific domain-containing protein n=1 Tax=Actinomadura sp. 7K507 TaxID=2530365 RepID=UPI001A9CE9EA|nr:group II intron maturase-specific domain-containing protein [Actinomadura sp. 7K507]
MWSWRLHRRTNLTEHDLARWLNPIVAGWMNYYGRFYRSELYPLLRRINEGFSSSDGGDLVLPVLEDAVQSTKHAVGDLAADTIRRAVDAHDGYAARDVLANDACAFRMTDRQERDLTGIVEACGLGTRTIPRARNIAFSTALTISEAILTSSWG